MQWVILVLGNILGGLVSAYSWKNRDSFILRILSFIIPVSVSVVFWVMRFKSGYVLKQFNAVSQSAAGGVNTVVNQVITIIVTSLVFTLSCKLLGILLAKYFMDKQ